MSYSSSDARTISVMPAAASSGAKPTDRSNPSGPVMSTRTIPRGSAAIHASCGPRSLLPPATTAA